MGEKSRGGWAVSSSMSDEEYSIAFRKKTRMKKQANTKRLKKKRQTGYGKIK